MIEVSVSEWTPARVSLADETVFAIGDVHGCAAELEALLDAIALRSVTLGHKRRLVFLGDLIDRGPSSATVLKLWARGEEERKVDSIDRLMGNHEQLLLLALSESAHREKAMAMWLSEAMGGGVFLEEMNRLASMSAKEPTFELLSRSLGDDVVGLFRSQKSHVTFGNLILVHAGLDPARSRTECLSEPWTSFTAARWAWVHGEFLRWQGGFDGCIVVHGHTPPHLHRELTGQEDPHFLAYDRLGLDGGTTRTGVVTAAEIRNGQYRIMRAGARAPAHGDQT